MKLLKIIALAATLGLFSLNHVHAQEMTPDTAKTAHKMKADTDQDGKISHEEFSIASEKRSEKHFKRMDANADGFIDKTEKQAACAKMREHHKPHRHEKPGAVTPG